MTGRTFPEVTVPSGPDRRRHQAFRIVCGHCRTESFFPVLSGSGNRRPSIAAEQHFQHDGWVVGSSHRKDRCPKHAFAKKEKPMPSKLAAAIDAAGPAETDPPKAEPPREMTRADRRIIMEKLDEVYGENCYRTPWTDASVAKDLGCPRAWVSDLREQFMGPEGTNPLFEEFGARFQALEPKVVELGEKAKRLSEDIGSFYKQAEYIGKETADLKRIGGRIERELGR